MARRNDVFDLVMEVVKIVGVIWLAVYLLPKLFPSTNTRGAQDTAANSNGSGNDSLWASMFKSLTADTSAPDWAPISATDFVVHPFDASAAAVGQTIHENIPATPADLIGSTWGVDTLS